MDDKARDRYLRAHYGVDLEWYNARLAQQDNRCGICRRPKETFTRNLSVDHCHATVRLKILSKKLFVASWWAGVVVNGRMIDYVAATKSGAIRGVKRKLKTVSARGLLCPFCNRGLRYYADDPIRLENAAAYLRSYHKSQGEIQ